MSLDELFEFARQGDVENLSIQVNNQNSLLTTADEAGWTLLHIAASIGNLPLLQVLLPLFPTVNLKTLQGATPLHYAASKGHLQAVQLILSQPQVQLLRDRQGWTAMHRACALGHLDILAELTAAFPRDLELADQEGNTLLHIAVQEQRLACAKLLLELGANIDVVNTEGKRPIDFVPLQGQEELKALLKA